MCQRFQMINLMSKTKRYIWFAISGIVIIPGIISLSLWGLKFGIDFTGGSLIELSFPAQKISLEQVKAEMKTLGLGEVFVQPSGERGYLLRVKEIDNAKYNEVTNEFQKKFGQVEKLRFETVGPTISKDLTQKAIIAVIVASIFIVLFIAWAFRKVPKPASSWRFGFSAVVALLHDVLVVTGIFSIFGHFFNIEIDSLFVTAILTVIGFSVHDTIVVFDRIRENLLTRRTNSFEETANISVVQTLGRSINTSMTVLIVLTCLYIFGASSIKHFILALLVGITTGTYSSIFNATPILIIWQNFIEKRKIKE